MSKSKEERLKALYAEWDTLRAREQTEWDAIYAREQTERAALRARQQNERDVFSARYQNEWNTLCASQQPERVALLARIRAIEEEERCAICGHDTPHERIRYEIRRGAWCPACRVWCFPKEAGA